MSNTSIHTHSQLCRNYIISILLLSLSLALCLSHAPSLASTHAHPHCTTSTCNLELYFPFLLLAFALPPCPSHLALLSVSHTCARTLKTRFPFEMSLQLSPSSGPLSLSFLFLLQFKLRPCFTVLTGEETCAVHFISWLILFYEFCMGGGG